MFEQNFPQQLISQSVSIPSLPVFIPDRLSLSLSQFNALKQRPNKYENMNIQKLLVGMQSRKGEWEIVSKGRSRGKSNKGKGEVFNACKEGEEFMNKKEMRLEKLREEKNKKELEGCTFQPNTKEKSKGGKRSLGEFLEQQQNFVKKVNAKKQMMKQHLNQKQRHEFRPSINSISHQRQDRPIHERLYELRDKQEVLIVPNKDEKFRPSISNKSKKLIRNEEIGKHLYDDALRRQNQSRKSLANITKTEDLRDRQKSINYTNQKYVAQRFIKQLYSVLRELNIDLENGLDYLTFNSLLFKLGFVTYLQQVDTKSAAIERSLVYQAYSLLSQANTGIKNICLFLLALIGIYHIDPINFNQKQKDIEVLNSIDDSSLNFNFTETEGRRLQKHFELLYRNRLFAQSAKRTKTQQNVPTTYSFKPQINKESSAMAENYRNKIMKETSDIIGEMELLTGEKIKHHDLLVLNKINKERLREEIRVEQEEKEFKKCTFKPNIIEKRNSINQSFDQGSSKCIELYNLHKKRLSKHEILEQKERLRKDQKFNDQFHSKQPKKHSKSTTIVPRSSDKQILRMLESRKQKQEINKFLERGYDKTVVGWGGMKDSKLLDGKNQEMRTHVITENNDEEEEKYEEETPFLVIDVNLGTEIDHITVYRSDIDQAQHLAHIFATKHNLDPDTKSRLIDLLQQQINNVISKIEQTDPTQP